MNTFQSFEALRRANPRAKVDFQESVDAAAKTVRALIVATPMPRSRRVQSRPRRRAVRVSFAGSALAVAAALVAFATVSSSDDAPGVADAAAAVKKAATVTAASADHSGTAVVRITHNGEVWAAKTIRWRGEDLAISTDHPRRRGHAGSQFLLVAGMMYGTEDGAWVALGSPASIDPDSGTTPAEYLAAVREDVGGVTLRRITSGMTGLKTRRLDDGSTVYNGSVAAGRLARETGFKEGRPIRVLPFGYVAHDEAADPAARLATEVTVGADGIVREIAVAWGSSASAWSYTVTYSNLGTTPAPVAPENARPLRERPRVTARTLP